MSAMIARYLKDFGSPVAEPLPSDEMPFGFPAVAGPEPEESVDAEAELRETLAREHEAAMAELSERHAAEMAALAESHAKEMADVRERCETDLVAMIASRITEMTGTIAHAVTEAAAQALVPVLSEAVAREAVKDFADMLKGAIEEGEVARIRLRGPETAFRRLSDLMGEKAELLDFEESAEMDLTAEIGTAVLVTRLSAFAAGLEKVME
ncbi:hypothetical protein NOF55_17155 [Rhizobiaceae bacterium BDR2-2]|uniref:Uncharacterized protein n=1 Tax=Ectorhizobium quercum TaxID=2965071 RepID=A0AAE3MXI7_9HYPH|nr:hypothetical protein [Ectorhizobium quercum]MCX8996117.1 hypothetical protein [Ectorhizobium quercum]MCX8998844.1 hypothetical protein [Ectorhizobium quercum]